MSRRRLRPEELELWDRVARTTKRRKGQPRHIPGASARADGATAGKDDNPPEEKLIAPFRVGASGGDGAPTHVRHLSSVSDPLAADPVRMDPRAFTRMKRGKLSPESRIDLHGMTLEQAHPALTGFILSSQSRGLRLVLVITGKGERDDPHDPLPRRRGVLKHQVPQWLRMPPVAQAVLQVTEAHRRHGGSGAFYVYLRRTR